MTDKQPTQEQVKEFWEWCGLKWFWNHTPDCHCGAKDDDDSVRSWHYFDDKGYHLATRFWNEDMNIDLNNLFKYAVPKLQDKGNNVELYAYEYKGYMATVYKDCFSQRGSDGYEPYLEPISQVKGDDPALALFWALYSIMKGGK